MIPLLLQQRIPAFRHLPDPKETAIHIHQRDGVR